MVCQGVALVRSRERSSLSYIHQGTPGSNDSATVNVLHSHQDEQQRYHPCRTRGCSAGEIQEGVYAPWINLITSPPERVPRPRSHLFTVRVWEEEIGTDQTEWRGKVQLLSNGDVRYFRDWAALVPLLLTMLSESDSVPESNE